MNARGPIARPVTLSLATRDTVSRVVARRHSVHAGWSRLTLRWRRRSPRQTLAAAGYTTIATHAYWFPQFHLHFTERAIQSLPQRISSNAPRLVAVRASPLFVWHRREAFIRARAVVASPRLSRATPGLAAGQNRASRTQTSATDEPPQVSRPPMSMAMSLPHKRRSMRPSIERTATLVHRRTAREQAVLIDSSRPTRWRESKGSRLSKLQPADMLSSGAVVRPPSRASHRPTLIDWSHPTRGRESKGSPLSKLRPADMPSLGAVVKPSSRGSHRPADLIWRKAPHTGAGVVDGKTRPAAHVPPQPVSLAVRSMQDTSPVDAHKDRPPVLLSAPSVDARLLDRLTDDVIRRVERRIRIERERRGL